MKIVYRSGKTNLNANALSRCPVGPAPVEGPGQNEVQVSVVSSSNDIETLPGMEEVDHPEVAADSFSTEQQKDEHLCEIIRFLGMSQLPSNETRARKIALQASLFTILDGVLMFVDSKRKDWRQLVVPELCSNA